ncbi:MAG: hypothetical protein LBH00_01315 [Planctomycetaceae bacterium]|jgi:hypothetical protein|nr:hypothetical protein [Planctomycetaceae bacterium]
MFRFFFCFGVSFVLSGCFCDPAQFRQPDLLHPGHISVQQERMNRFDPFAKSGIGPKIDGDYPAPEGFRDQTSGMRKYYDPQYKTQNGTTGN